MYQNNYKDTITIHSKNYDKKQLQNIDFSQLPNWEKDIYKFILQWIDKSDVFEIKTSGSTGKPKTIHLNKSTMLQSALNTGHFFNLEKGDKALLCLPASYIAGKMMIVRAFVLGLDLYWQKPQATPVIDTNYKFVAMTAMQVQNIIDKNINELNKIDILIIGGSTVNDRLKSELQYTRSKVYETYGMTETASHIALRAINTTKASEYFKVLKGIEIGIDERSCLMIKNSNLGIKNLITNDIIELKQENIFKWLGRYDNVINSGGIKLIPEQIEQKLKKYIKTDFIIFGIKDDLFNELPALIIEGEYNLDENIFDKLLSKYEKPKRIFKYPEFPRTKSGKIKRPELIELIEKTFEQ